MVTDDDLYFLRELVHEKINTCKEYNVLTFVCNMLIEAEKNPIEPPLLEQKAG